MAFPIYFIAGAAVGAIATYIYKDNKTRGKLSDASNRLKDGANAFIAGFRQDSGEPPVQSASQITNEVDNSNEPAVSGTTDDSGTVRH